MRPRLALQLAIVVTLTFAAPSLKAAVFIVPPDEALVHDADAVFVGVVFSAVSRFDADGEIVTDVAFETELVLKGDVGDRIVLTEPGGIVGTEGRHVSGAPKFYPGERALVFAERRDEQLWWTWGLELGKFSFVFLEDGRRVLVRGANQGEIFGWDFLGRRHLEPLRNAELFVAFVSATVRGEPFDRDYRVRRFFPELPRDWLAPGGFSVVREEVVVSPTDERAIEGPVLATAHVPPSAYTMGTFRWKLFDEGGTVGYRITGSQPGYDSAGAAQRALQAWTNDAGSNVRLALESGTGGPLGKDGINSVVFNSSTDVPSGAIGYAQIYSSGIHEYKGESFYTVVEGDAVMKANLAIPAKAFEEAVTHEIGHTIALRHSDIAEPSSNDAVMRSVISGDRGANLAPWDIDAVGHVYTTAIASLVAPTAVVATATNTNQVLVTWTAVIGADSYRVERKAPGGTFVTIVTVTGTSFTDTSVQAGTSYLYRVIAIASTSESDPSASDLATTIVFSDSPLAPGSTVVKAVHLTELRAAVNAARSLAGIPIASWTDSNPQGVTVKAIHWTELLDRLIEARTALGLLPVAFPSSVAPGALIRAAHVEALRSGVR